MRSGSEDLIASIALHSDDPSAQVVRCSWSALGGPDQAVLQLPDKGGLEFYRHLLGQPVEIFTSSGSRVWWGYVSTVRRMNGHYPQVIDLEPMANRVSACYEDLEPGVEPGQDKQTAWYELVPSQLDYGIKEKVLSFGMVSSGQAIQAVARFLNDHAWPALSLEGHSLGLGSSRSVVLKNEEQTKSIEFVCQGWIQRLSWRTWQTKSGMLGHSPVQVGSQKIGEVSANQRFAQSFKLDMTQDVSYVQLRFRKEGGPTDNLNISIQSDSSGLPSATALASVSLAASSISADSFGWCQVNFAVMPKLTAGVNYWLVMQRSGLLNPAAYFLAGVDEGAGYLNGVSRVYNSSNGLWSMRLPMADLLFKFGLLKATDELIQELYSAVAQEFSGLQIETPTGLTLAPFVPKPMDGLSALKMLLELGSNNLVPLLAWVSPEKLLRIYPQPSGLDPAFLIDDKGNLCDRFGNEVDLESLPTGQWVTVTGSQAVFVRQVMWEATNGRLTINY